MSQYLSEAFKRLDALNEDTFKISDDGLEEFEKFTSEDELDTTIDVIDPEAKTEEDVQDSYVGKVILDCVVCHSKIYKDKEDVVIKDEIANEGEECPFCYTPDGYKVIGQVSAFVEEEDEKEEADEDSKEVDESLNEGIFGIKTKKEKEKEAKAKAEKEAQRKREFQAKAEKERERFAERERERDARSKETQRRLDAYDAAKRRSGSNGGTGGNTGKAGIHYSGGDYYSESLDEGIFDKFKKDKTLYTIWQERDGFAHPVRYNVEGEKEAKKSAAQHMEGHSDSHIKKHNIKYFSKPQDKEAEKKAMDDYHARFLDAEDSDAKPETNPKNTDTSKSSSTEVESGAEKHRQSSKGGSREVSSDTYKKSQLKGTRPGNANIGNEGDKYVGRSTADQDSAPNVDTQDTPKKRKDRKAQAAFSRTHDEQGMKKDRARAISQTKDSANESLKESVNNVNVETDEDVINVATDDNGKVTVTTEPKQVQVAEGEEMITPVEPEVKDELESNVGDGEEIEIDLDEFDEETFDELGEGYLKKVYENVNSFKTSKVSFIKDKLIVEGKINFKSGKTKKTNFIFESREATKSGKVRFIGENKEIARGKKSFTVTGKVEGGKFLPESLNYNYGVKGSNGKAQRLYGTVRTKKVGK